MTIKRKKKKKGVAFVISIVALGVMMLVGTAFLRTASVQYQQVSDARDSVKSLALADASFHYMFWVERWSADESTTESPLDYAHLPTIADNQLTSITAASTPSTYRRDIQLGPNPADTASVWLLDHDSPGTTPTVQMICKGNSNGYPRTVRAVCVPGNGVGNWSFPDWVPGIAEYVIFSDDFYSGTGNATVIGNLGANGPVTMVGNANIQGNMNTPAEVNFTGNVNVTGGVHYGTTISPSSTPRATQDGAKVPFPVIDKSAWLSYATAQGQVITGSLHYSGNVHLTSPVYYIKKNADGSGGDLHLSGNVEITGGATIVCEGGISFSGNASLTAGYTATTCNVTIVSCESITLTGNAYMRGAFVYAHNPARDADPDAEKASVRLSGNGYINYGAIIADNVTFTGNANITYRAPTFPFTSPSLSTKTWRLASWEIL